MESLDPRIARLHDIKAGEAPTVGHHDYGETWEVFHQAKRGKHHAHVGTVHAPDPELAMVYAKEQFGRRQTTTNLWVVRTADIFALSYEDADMFATTPEKIHREAAGYKTRDKIAAFKQQQAQES